jgi:RNA-directed DNA polymerase
MMNGRGKSDSAIVAGKPTNKAGQPAAESVEPSAEAEGNASQQSTRRAQDRESVSQALERIRQVARQRKKERFTRSSTISALNYSGWHSSPSSEMPHRVWMG